MGEGEVRRTMSNAVTTEPTAAPAPEQPPPLVPWDAGEISFLLLFGILVFLTVFFWPSVVVQGLNRTGFFAWYYPGHPPNLGERQSLWAVALAFPLQLATILVLAAQLLGVGPSRLGLKRAQFGRNVGLGAAGACVLTPAVLALHVVAVWLLSRGLGVAEEKHAFTRLAEHGLTRAEWGLMFVAAVIAAPVLEELLFRGIFQQAASNCRWGGVVGVTLAGALAVIGRYDKLEGAVRQLRSDGWATGAPAVVTALLPLLFVLCLLAVLLFALRWGASRRAAAVFGTSAFFAMIHVVVWPSPIALVVLALGLGWLKEQTQSLVGPVVVHALFNGVSFTTVTLGVN
jgi:membrane protease YdiL (CAAX protease family)